MPGSSSWMPCAPQVVKGLDDDDDDDDDESAYARKTDRLTLQHTGKMLPAEWRHLKSGNSF